MSTWGLLNRSVAFVGVAWVVACGGRSVDGAPSAFSSEGGRTVVPGAGFSGGGSPGGEHAGGSSSGGHGEPSGTDGGSPSGGRPTRECGLLIDDMEDGSGRICHGDGRVGVWYAYNDGFGVQLPAPEPQGTPILPSVVTGAKSSPASTRAMYSFHHYPDPTLLNWSVGWGAGIGFDLASDGAHYGTFSAAGFTGISFWVRSDLTVWLLVRANTLLTTPATYGGACPNDFCGTWSYSVAVTKDWVKQAVSFEQLGSYFWSPDLRHPVSPAPVLDPALLTNIQFLFVEYPTDTADRDIWIDDVSFYR